MNTPAQLRVSLHGWLLLPSHLVVMTSGTLWFAEQWGVALTLPTWRGLIDLCAFFSKYLSCAATCRGLCWMLGISPRVETETFRVLVELPSRCVTALTYAEG